MHYNHPPWLEKSLKFTSLTLYVLRFLGLRMPKGVIRPLHKIPYTCPWDLKLGMIVKWLKNFRTTSKVCRWRHGDVIFLLTSSNIRQIRQILEIIRTFQQKVVDKRLTPRFFRLRMLSSKKYYLVHSMGNICWRHHILWSKFKYIFLWLLITSTVYIYI